MLYAPTILAGTQQVDASAVMIFGIFSSRLDGFETVVVEAVESVGACSLVWLSKLRNPSVVEKKNV